MKHHLVRNNYNLLKILYRTLYLLQIINFSVYMHRTPPTYNKGHRKKLAFTNRFYLTFFLNSIGLLAKKEKNHNNVT